MRCDSGKIVSVEGACASITHIIGNANISGDVAVDLRELPSLRHCKLIFINHTIPQDYDVNKDSFVYENTMKKVDNLVKIAQKSDFVLSVGHLMYEQWNVKYEEHEMEIPHELLLPNWPVEFEAKPKNNDLKRFLFFGRAADAYAKGLYVAAGAVNRLYTEESKRDPKLRFSFVVRGVVATQEKITQHQMNEEMGKVFGKKLQRSMILDIRPFGTLAEVRKDLRGVDVVLMASPFEPFGLTGLEAIAAGKFVFMSSNSGLAMLCREANNVAADHFIVEGDSMVESANAEHNIDKWYEKMEAFYNLPADEKARLRDTLRTKVKDYLNSSWKRFQIP